MPSFKTHLNALLESFGLDYEHAQTFNLNYTANTIVYTSFTAPCDGFLFASCASNVTGLFIEELSLGGKNVISLGRGNTASWRAICLLVSKGREYRVGVEWTDTAQGNSSGVFVPFTYSRQKS